MNGLDLKLLKKNKNIIKFNIPDDIILYDTDELSIKIKYFEEDSGLYDNSIRSVKVLPYICVSSSKIITVKKIMTYIQLITRFFAILMGYSGKVNKILFHKMYNGKSFMENFEDELVINTDFTNKYDIRVGYPTHNLRTYFKDLSDDIKDMYGKWFELYFNKKYSIYDYLANTRNYYIHLDKGEYIIKDEYIPGYCRKLEKLFVSKLLNLIIIDKKYLNERICIDRYLRLYDDRDS